MKIFLLAGMLVGAALFSPVCVADDATTLPSVMKSKTVAAAPSGAPVDNSVSPATNPVNPLRGAETPSTNGASDAPAWTPPAGSLPQALPEVSDAKPLVPAPDPGAPPMTEQQAPMGSDGKLILPSPPDMVEQPGQVQPAGHQELLPPPSRNSASAPSNSTLPPALGNSVVVPPASSSPPVDLATQAAARAAADLLRGSFDAKSPDVKWHLPLRQFLERSAESDRAAIARAYWQLSRAYSNLGWARDEQKRLEQIVPSRGGVESPMLSTARGAAAARVTEAEVECTRALAALQSVSFEDAAKYSTVDLPLVGPYHTYYSQIFASRPSAKASMIDKAMPIRLKSINDWAATVHSANGAVHYAEEAHAKGTVDLRTVLACHDDLRLQRRRFLDAVMQYNLEIAEYAALAAPAGTSAEKFASMLIPAKPPERLSAVPTRPALPLGAGGQRQLPAGQQQAVGDRHLPWGDGWMPRSSSSPPPAPIAESRGATGDWQDPKVSGLPAPPVEDRSKSTPPADPFAGGGLGSRYSTPPGR